MCRQCPQCINGGKLPIDGRPPTPADPPPTPADPAGSPPTPPAPRRRTTPSYRLLQGVPRSLIPAKQGGKVTGMGLSERDRAILDFERVWSFERGPKEEAIRAELGLSARRYYQLLASLLDSEDADRYDPLVVRRLRRLRTERRKARLIGRPAGWRTSR